MESSLLGATSNGPGLNTARGSKRPLGCPDGNPAAELHDPAPPILFTTALFLVACCPAAASIVLTIAEAALWTSPMMLTAKLCGA